MKDYYKILGVSPSASESKIRRAYRILARRYHPDVNPGHSSSEKFKDIAEAYSVLKEQKNREKYDRDLAKVQYAQVDARIKAYKKAQEHKTARQQNYYQQQKKDYDTIKAWQDKKQSAPQQSPTAANNIAVLKSSLRQLGKEVSRILGSRVKLPLIGAKKKTETKSILRQLSIIEVPVSIKEAVYGSKKNVTLEDGIKKRILKVSIPPGVRNGSVVRLKDRKSSAEELVLIVRLEKHPFLRIDPEGLLLEVPITIHEAIAGASIQVPTLDDSVSVKIQPNSQSGTRIRLKEKGIPHKGKRGDLIIELMVKVPESEHAVGIKEKSAELDLYYESPVRQNLPKTLLE